ncbi:LysR family transcriptional regulator [Agrobacterium vitis]|uniref:LysR family transcriptional regulator n=2 Tax=Agrobacterium vitis TaxID=373 RepID=A0A368NYJ2_AGRVI|nr:LysR family transcriptional regulator [Agrobacterium vitis]KAA3528027.1 LysR family transcriptional regulator [Agrobacterium vitis]RCU55622.1 LysR family transcriptional regulator [Agrobacterium vitis]
MQLIFSSGILLDAVARAGFFRGAAEKLNMYASAINRRIINLEHGYSVALAGKIATRCAAHSSGGAEADGLRFPEEKFRVMRRVGLLSHLA